MLCSSAVVLYPAAIFATVPALTITPGCSLCPTASIFSLLDFHVTYPGLIFHVQRRHRRPSRALTRRDTSRTQSRLFMNTGPVPHGLSTHFPNLHSNHRSFRPRSEFPASLLDILANFSAVTQTTVVKRPRPHFAEVSFPRLLLVPPWSRHLSRRAIAHGLTGLPPPNAPRASCCCSYGPTLPLHRGSSSYHHQVPRF